MEKSIQLQHLFLKQNQMDIMNQLNQRQMGQHHLLLEVNMHIHMIYHQF